MRLKFGYEPSFESTLYLFPFAGAPNGCDDFVLLFGILSFDSTLSSCELFLGETCELFLGEAFAIFLGIFSTIGFWIGSSFVFS